MPKVARSKKRRPEGWELIEPTLEELDKKMREAETDSHEGKRKVEALWPIFKIHHQRSRYIFDLFYRRKAISRGKERYILQRIQRSVRIYLSASRQNIVLNIFNDLLSKFHQFFGPFVDGRDVQIVHDQGSGSDQKNQDEKDYLSRRIFFFVNEIWELPKPFANAVSRWRSWHIFHFEI